MFPDDQRYSVRKNFPEELIELNICENLATLTPNPKLTDGGA